MYNDGWAADYTSYRRGFSQTTPGRAVLTALLAGKTSFRSHEMNENLTKDK